MFLTIPFNILNGNSNKLLLNWKSNKLNGNGNILKGNNNKLNGNSNKLNENIILTIILFLRKILFT